MNREPPYVTHAPQQDRILHKTGKHPGDCDGGSIQLDLDRVLRDDPDDEDGTDTDTPPPTPLSVEILRHIYTTGPKKRRELAAELPIGESSIAGSLHRMKTRGHIKSRLDATDPQADIYFLPGRK